MLSRIAAMLTGDGRRGLANGLALVTALGGVIAIVVGLLAQQSPARAPQAMGTLSPRPSQNPTGSPHASHSSQPTSSSPVTTAAPSPSRDVPSAADAAKPPRDKDQPDGAVGKERPSGADRAPRSNRIRVLPASVPTSISIPAIDVHSEVFPIGKTPDGTIKVPQPGPNLNKAAWYKHSPTPGQAGPSIIEGHVDSEQQGPSVFWDLAELRPGDVVKVTRADGKVAVFTVDALRTYPKDEFPTKAVYGGDLKHPQLRLITCAIFDDSIDHYVGNLVVFTHMTAVHHAG